MRSLVNFLTIIFLSLSALTFGQVYKNPSATIENRVDDLLSQMTLDEKIGQMAQAERSAVYDNNDISSYFIGSVISGGGSSPSVNSPEGWADMYDQMQEKALSTRLGIPIMYGIDAVHGHNNLYGAVIFPHNIGMGCTRNPLLVREAAQITATEVAASGLDWTFAPCVTVPQNEHWGRTYEGFGENPELVRMMASAAVEGFQGDTLSNNTSIIACAKHFVGDGGTYGGTDQGNTILSESDLRAIHLPGYIDAINAGVGTVMASFSSWNGEKMHSNKYLLTDVLKTELGFKGPIVSDWNAIQQLPGSYKERVKAAINAGIDIAMEPYYFDTFIPTLKQLVNEGEVSEERINDAVRRILTLKFKAGIFEHPYAERSLFDSVGSDYHRAVARQCVRESLVLLKKRDNLLPLPKKNIKIHVAGRNANNIGDQCGGWTISWQGYSGNITPGTTIYEGLQEVAPENSYFYTADGTEWLDEDVAIAVIGEKPYAEYMGDRSSIDNLISNEDIEAVRRLKSYDIPVIVVLISGRPVNISEIYPYADAIIAGWLPGTEGQGIADVLFGGYEPKGKLSHSWPKNDQQVPVNYYDNDYEPLYPYGFGINTFENSLNGSAPELYSVVTDKSGLYIELSFNKKMMDPSSEISSFSININEAPTVITSAEFTRNDSSRIKLYTGNSIKSNEMVTVSYIPGDYMSADSGMVAAISDYKVKNQSEIATSAPAQFSNEEEFSIFPNPFTGDFFIQVNQNISEFKMEIIDPAGRIIYFNEVAKPSDQIISIHPKSVEPGIYIIRMYSNNRSVSKKVLAR